MRTKNTILNVIATILLFSIKVLLNFIGRTLLIRYLGDNYNGISSLFSNIVSILSIADMGIGSAIIYNLYKPVSENDINTIKSIMKFYKQCYHIIAIVVFFIGLCILPFISDLVGVINIADNIFILFLLFLTDTVLSYLFTYKRSILYVNQRNYIISYIDILYYMILNTGQILIIIYSKNYLLYLVFMIVCRFVENIVINYYVNKKYRYLTDRAVEKINIKIKKDIVEKVKGLLFHQIGSYIVLGTDNIIISKFLGVIYVGFYSNYLIILNPISSIISQIISATTASVGNLLVEKDTGKNYNIYRKISLICFWLYSFSSICIFFLAQDFIKIWLGNKYLLSNKVLLVLVFNFYLQGMRCAIGVFKTAAGIYYEDRYVPVVESIINIIISIILVNKLGISGVLIGTIISSIPLFLYSFPFLVYKRMFEKSVKYYFGEQLKYLIILVLIFVLSYVCNNFFVKTVTLRSNIIYFILKVLYMFLVSNILLLFVWVRSKDFREVFIKIRNILFKKLNKYCE